MTEENTMLSDCSFKGTKTQKFSQETERIKINGAYTFKVVYPTHPACSLIFS